MRGLREHEAMRKSRQVRVGRVVLISQQLG